ncbi:hypothetical protein BBRP734_02004 [Bifidobacterium breve]|nr:hypothetical protein BBRP734_02004 [Bifidobacterium breve]
MGALGSTLTVSVAVSASPAVLYAVYAICAVVACSGVVNSSILFSTITSSIPCASTVVPMVKSVLSAEMSLSVTGTLADVLGRSVMSSSRAWTLDSDAPWNTPTRICACARCPVQSSTA